MEVILLFPFVSSNRCISYRSGRSSFVWHFLPGIKLVFLKPSLRSLYHLSFGMVLRLDQSWSDSLSAGQCKNGSFKIMLTGKIIGALKSSHGNNVLTQLVEVFW